MPSKMMGTGKFALHDKKITDFFWKKARTYRHFRNQYLSKHSSKGE